MDLKNKNRGTTLAADSDSFKTVSELIGSKWFIP